MTPWKDANCIPYLSLKWEIYLSDNCEFLFFLSILFFKYSCPSKSQTDSEFTTSSKQNVRCSNADRKHSLPWQCWLIAEELGSADTERSNGCSLSKRKSNSKPAVGREDRKRTYLNSVKATLYQKLSSTVYGWQQSPSYRETNPDTSRLENMAKCANIFICMQCFIEHASFGCSVKSSEKLLCYQLCVYVFKFFFKSGHPCINNILFMP